MMYLITIISKKVLADGGYDSKYNFRYLEEMKLIPAIKVRKNSSVKTTQMYSTKTIRNTAT